MQTDSATSLTPGGQGAGGPDPSTAGGAGGASPQKTSTVVPSESPASNPDQAALVEERDRLRALNDKLLGEKKAAQAAADAAREAEKKKLEEEGNLKALTEITRKERDEALQKLAEAETTSQKLKAVESEAESYRALAAESVAARLKAFDETTTGKLRTLHPTWDKLSPLEQLTALDRFMAVIGVTTSPGRTTPGGGALQPASGESLRKSFMDKGSSLEQLVASLKT